MPANPALTALPPKDPPIEPGPSAPASPSGVGQQAASPGQAAIPPGGGPATPTVPPAPGKPPPSQTPPSPGQPPGPGQGTAPDANAQRGEPGGAPGAAKPGAPAGTGKTGAPDSDDPSDQKKPSSKASGSDKDKDGHRDDKDQHHKHHKRPEESQKPYPPAGMPPVLPPGASGGAPPGSSSPSGNGRSPSSRAAPAQPPAPQMQAPPSYPPPSGGGQPALPGIGDNASYNPLRGRPYASLPPPGANPFDDTGNLGQTWDAAGKAGRSARQRMSLMDQYQNELDGEFDRYKSENAGLQKQIENKKTEADKAVTAARQQGLDADTVEKYLSLARDALEDVEKVTNESGEQAKRHSEAMKRITEKLSGAKEFGMGTPGHTSPTGFAFPLDDMSKAHWNYGDQRPGHIHRGVDLYAPEGTPIHAAADGTVVDVRRLEHGGSWIVLQHTDNAGHTYYTEYIHPKSSSVAKGDSVSAGQVIGAVGRLGMVNSPAHVHFEVRYGDYGAGRGTPVNPRDFFYGNRYAQTN